MHNIGNPASSQRNSDKDKGGLLLLCCTISLLLGYITAALGPCLGDLAANTASSLAAVGSIFSALFLGALVAQVLAGPLGDRIGQGAVLLGGSILLGLGILGLALSRTLPLTLAAVCLAGLGHGSTDLASLVLAARRYEHRSVTALNLVGLAFGLGAFVGPAVAGLSSRLLGTTIPSLWAGVIGVALLLIPIALLAARERRALAEAGGGGTPAPEEGRKTGPRAGSFRHTLALLAHKPLVWGLGGLLLVYVGSEQAMGGWTAEYISRTTGSALATAALGASLYWLALSGGRLIAAGVGARASAKAVLGGGITLAFLGTALLWTSTGHLGLSFVAIALIGAGYGSIYPTAFAMTAAAVPEAPGTATSVVSALGSFGGMVFPWAQGLVLIRWGARSSALFVLLLAALMLGLFALQGRLGRRPLDRERASV